MQSVTIVLMLLLTGITNLVQDGGNAGDKKPAQEQAGSVPPNAERPQNGPQQGRGGFGGPIELGLDDKQIFPDPADSIVAKRDDIPHGKLEMIVYESKTVGTSRKLNVYTPADSALSEGERSSSSLERRLSRARPDSLAKQPVPLRATRFQRRSFESRIASNVCRSRLKAEFIGQASVE